MPAPPLVEPIVSETSEALSHTVIGGGEPAGAWGLSVPTTCEKAKTPLICCPITVSTARVAGRPRHDLERLGGQRDRQVAVGVGLVHRRVGGVDGHRDRGQREIEA